MMHITLCWESNKVLQHCYRFVAAEKTPLLPSRCKKHSRVERDNMRTDVCGCRMRLANRKLVVDFLAILFGVGAWISVNGMYVQLPLLVQTQPEKWNLPSYISVLVQIANIGPILYTISQRFFPNKLKDSWIIYGILILGSTALLLMSFFYTKTTIVFGEEHSTVLFILAFFISLVGCTSSVLFMPFMNNFREVYLISYFVGEGLSGFLPSVVALIQGVGGNPMCRFDNGTIVHHSTLRLAPVLKNSTIPGSNTTTLVPYTPPPRFSSQGYFLFLFATTVLSTFSFFLLNHLRSCKSEKVSLQQEKTRLKFAFDVHSSQNTENEGPSNLAIVNDGTDLPPYDRTVSMSRKNSLNCNGSGTGSDVLVLESPRVHQPLPRHIYMYFLVLAAWLCLFGNGLFPSIQSYSCLPYGNVAYHLSVTMASMANPVACFFAFFMPYSSVRVISVLSGLCTIVSTYIAATAVLSPTPPLVNTMVGEGLVVLSWVVFTALISYVKVSIASLLRREGGRALFWCGAVQQMGSAVGAIIAFILVNCTDIFKPYVPCQ